MTDSTLADDTLTVTVAASWVTDHNSNDEGGCDGMLSDHGEEIWNKLHSLIPFWQWFHKMLETLNTLKSNIEI